jgi:hypothetical protein
VRAPNIKSPTYSPRLPPKTSQHFRHAKKNRERIPVIPLYFIAHRSSVTGADNQYDATRDSGRRRHSTLRGVVLRAGIQYQRLVSSALRSDVDASLIDGPGGKESWPRCQGHLIGSWFFSINEQLIGCSTSELRWRLWKNLLKIDLLQNFITWHVIILPVYV